MAENISDHNLLYKYRRFDSWLFELLINRELWCAQPASLNDPHDCQVDLSSVLEAAVSAQSDQNVRKVLHSLQSYRVIHKKTDQSVPLHEALSDAICSAGVLTLSRTATAPLMWSHYADGHSGICIGFEEQFFMKLTSEEYERNRIIGICDACYTDVPPYEELMVRFGRDLYDRFSNDPTGDHKVFLGDFENTLIQNGLSTKSSDWKYENEVRLLRHEPGLLSFPASAIKEIVFGRKMSDKNMQTIRRLLSAREWCHVVYRHAFFRSNKFEMELVGER